MSEFEQNFSRSNQYLTRFKDTPDVIKLGAYQNN